VESIAYTAKKNLMTIKGMTEAKIDKIVEAVQKMISNGFKTASEILKCRENIFYISTGSSVKLT
jgi:DNA repair protein RAD51